MIRTFIASIQKRSELIILMIMILVIVMLVIPLPTMLIDFFIGLNFSIALLIFLGAFYVVNILDFSTFPSILLISTVFRLAISISTTRLILMNANAGEIITSFGDFVIADNLIVGFVVFSIVTIVQFIVITKGSERIAEVAARFSLDAMPGKQMSIDADLRAGLIDENDVKKLRINLAAESQLYGALDGAMKFIKGDAIAGIIIIFVNMIGGISVGTIQHGMNISEALSVYTTLTIGEALVSQIPALLIGISGGFIVTRVNNSEDKNLGTKIIHDVLVKNSSILIITAILILAIGFLPGFPLPVFLTLSLIMGGAFFKNKYDIGKGNIDNNGNGVISEDEVASNQYVHINIPNTIPLIIKTYKGNEDVIRSYNILQRLKEMFFVEYGVYLPDIVVSYSEKVDISNVLILINEIEAASYVFLPGMSRVLGRGEELKIIDDSVQCIENFSEKTYWLPDKNCDKVEKLGYYTRSFIDDFFFFMSTLLAHNINEFFGIQETKALLDQLENSYPELLKECYRNNTVQRITEVFQRLLQERISIRNTKLIIETLVQWSPKEKDPIMLVEYIRGSLARYISNRFAVNGRLRVIVLAHNVEDLIRSGIRQTSGGAFINMTPPETESFISQLDEILSNSNTNMRDIVLMVSTDLRRFVKKLIDSYYPELEVLSFSEIDKTTSVEIMATLGN
ncbi:EscV/YscV/HrcV family type III secretion system export apparatus protein [Salmonella enterica]|nr:EscV/YscV/HrcV family type III secretion system export apparatus protein [Salmonella enterica]